MHTYCIFTEYLSTLFTHSLQQKILEELKLKYYSMYYNHIKIKNIINV